MKKTLRLPSEHENAWIRNCNECGHKQVAKRPDTTKELTESYRNSKCKNCWSTSLDYGCENASLYDDLEDSF